jgi:flagellin-like hook-associated protein FlgL
VSRIHMELGVFALLLGCDTGGEPQPADAGVDASDKLSASCGESAVALAQISEAIAIGERADEATADVERAVWRIHALAARSASEGLGDSERSRFQRSFSDWSDQIQRTALAARYRDAPLATAAAEDHTVSVDGGEITLPLVDLRQTTLGVDTGSLDLSTAQGGQNAMDMLQWTESNLASHRGALGEALGALYEAAEAHHAALRACAPAVAEAFSVRCNDRRDASAEAETGAARVQRALALNAADARVAIARADAATAHSTDVVSELAALARAAADAGASDDDRADAQSDYLAMAEELGYIAEDIEYRGIRLTNGRSSTLNIQLADRWDGRVALPLGDLRVTVLGIDSGSLYLEDPGSASDAEATLEEVLDGTLADYQAGYAEADAAMISGQDDAGAALGECGS